MTKEKQPHCSQCGTYLENIAARLELGYGSKFDGELHNFCSDECLVKWVNQNIWGEDE